MVKIQAIKGKTKKGTTTEQYTITLPSNIVRLKGWGKGTEIVFIQDTFGNIMLKETRG